MDTQAIIRIKILCEADYKVKSEKQKSKGNSVDHNWVWHNEIKLVA
jgi:hypothetical protein